MTILLIAASVATAFYTDLGKKDAAVAQLAIVPYVVRPPWIHYAHLSESWYREPWRLLTPIFLHFGFMHILFNLLMLAQLGGLIEAVRGSWRFLVFVLLIAVPSNIAQYLWSGPQFGGMSGVVYGLFGYIWMKSRYEPGSGFYVAPNTVVWMVGWFFMCLFQIIPGVAVANAVHATGFAVGIILGRWPSLWRSLRWTMRFSEDAMNEFRAASRPGTLADAGRAWALPRRFSVARSLKRASRHNGIATLPPSCSSAPTARSIARPMSSAVSGSWATNRCKNAAGLLAFRTFRRDGTPLPQGVLEQIDHESHDAMRVDTLPLCIAADRVQRGQDVLRDRKGLEGGLAQSAEQSRPHRAQVGV